MSLYGFKGLVTPIKTSEKPSLNCPNIEETCCTEEDENLALTLWNTQNKHRIEKYYEIMLYSLKFLLGYGIEIEKLAKTIKTTPGSGGTNCRDEANEYLEINVTKELIKNIFYAVVKGLEEVSDLRRGFYCNICDAHTQQDIHYNRINPFINSKFFFNQDFCRQFVSDTIQASYYQVFYIKPYLLKATNLMKCITRDKTNLSYNIGYLKEKTVKNCYYFQQKYFFYFCEPYCEAFSMIKSSSIIEGDMNQIRPFVKFFNEKKDHLFEDPSNNILMGSLSYEDEYLMENIDQFSNEIVFFPPMSDQINLKDFVIDVELEEGVNPYYSAKGATFGITLAYVGRITMGVVGLCLLINLLV